jgi:hypothetical protein
LIFGVIAAAWLVYLVPYFLHRRGLPDDEIDAAYSTTTVTIVRTGSDLANAEEALEDESLEAGRKAKLDELTLIDQRAATRRRSVLIFLLAAEIMVAVLAALGVGVWWGALIPAGLIVVFLIIARVTVRRMRKGLAARAAEIREGADDAEDTQTVKLTDADIADHEHSIELSLPVPKLQTLWEPIPITRPNYVSQPLAPRTVRTIDLSAPIAGPGGIPVTIDDPLPKRDRRAG